VSESKVCVGCVNPNPTPCPTPNLPPPNGRTDCYWIKSTCDYACGFELADIAPNEWQDSGLFWDFAGAFDIAGSGRIKRLAWIQGDDAFLALDRACSSSPAGRIFRGAERVGAAAV